LLRDSLENSRPASPAPGTNNSDEKVNLPAHDQAVASVVTPPQSRPHTPEDKKDSPAPEPTAIPSSEPTAITEGETIPRATTPEQVAADHAATQDAAAKTAEPAESQVIPAATAEPSVPAPTEAEVQEKERVERERLEQERLEKERLEKEAAEKERLAEQERLAKEAEAARLEQERLERERLEQERQDRENFEKLRREHEETTSRFRDEMVELQGKLEVLERDRRSRESDSLQKEGRLRAEVAELQTRFDVVSQAKADETRAYMTHSTQWGQERVNFQRTISQLESQLSEANHDKSRFSTDLDRMKSRLERDSKEIRWPEERVDYEELPRLRVPCKSVKARHAPSRNHASIQDTREPADIVKAFSALNVFLRNTCFSISNHIVDQYATPEARASITSRADIAALRNSPLGAELLKHDAANNLDAYVEVAVRHAISRSLAVGLFQKFHPYVRPRIEGLVRELYEAVQSKESQVKAAQWRCAAYRGLDVLVARSKPDIAWAESFASHIQSQVIKPLLQKLFGLNDPAYRLPAKEHDALVIIGLAAYRWNQDVKSSFMSLDFNVVAYDEGEKFLNEGMRLEDDDVVAGRKVLGSVGLGLQSSMCFGSAREKEFVWQEKVAVVTEGYFDTD
jgi:hypothetical protein